MTDSIAGELLAAMNAKKFRQIIPSLPSGCEMSEDTFPRTSLPKKYTLDVNQWLDGSFMNPNAMFELFAGYSGQTTLQVGKAMLQYLSVTHKRGMDNSNILKNAWISLHMNGLSARQWADSKFLNEISLFVLCKMFQRHIIVFTSAKCWTTLEVESLCSEDDIFNSCDIRLLYIELGVFGELRK